VQGCCVTLQIHVPFSFLLLVGFSYSSILSARLKQSNQLLIARNRTTLVESLPINFVTNNNCHSDHYNNFLCHRHILGLPLAGNFQGVICKPICILLQSHRNRPMFCIFFQKNSHPSRLSKVVHHHESHSSSSL